jgi:hypothetical protein
VASSVFPLQRKSPYHQRAASLLHPKKRKSCDQCAIAWSGPIVVQNSVATLPMPNARFLLPRASRSLLHLVLRVMVEVRASGAQTRFFVCLSSVGWG